MVKAPGMIDVAVVGGGPAGLAVAIEAASRGLEVVVLEGSPSPPDKACGEGLMPPGVRALARLVDLGRLSPDDVSPFHGIRYVQEDGTTVEGRFPRGAGLGIRRTALVLALAARARELGARIRGGAVFRGMERLPHGVRVALDGEALDARILVGADGIASPVRAAAGLEGAPAGGRFGLRQHFARRPWSDLVEVHWGDGADAYVTPAGRERVNVAFQWDPRSSPGARSFASLLDRFPVLRERLDGAPADSSPRGLGPLARRARACVAGRVVLVGDAAGFVDGIAGEGVALAFRCAEALGAALPRALARGATRASLSPYERTFHREYGRYAFVTGGLLAIAGRPALRRVVLRGLARCPRLFQALLGRVAASGGPPFSARTPAPSESTATSSPGGWHESVRDRREAG
jgi:flavin-dependent dehydrogenase